MKDKLGNCFETISCQVNDSSWTSKFGNDPYLLILCTGLNS